MGLAPPSMSLRRTASMSSTRIARCGPPMVLRSVVGRSDGGGFRYWDEFQDVTSAKVEVGDYEVRVLVADDGVDAGAHALVLGDELQADHVAIEGDGLVPVTDNEPGVVQSIDHGCLPSVKAVDGGQGMGDPLPQGLHRLVVPFVESSPRLDAEVAAFQHPGYRWRVFGTRVEIGVQLVR